MSLEGRRPEGDIINCANISNVAHVEMLYLIHISQLVYQFSNNGKVRIFNLDIIHVCILYSTGHKYCNISTGVLVDFHMIHYTQIIWKEVAFIWKVTGKAVAIFMTSTVAMILHRKWHTYSRCTTLASHSIGSAPHIIHFL